MSVEVRGERREFEYPVIEDWERGHGGGYITLDVPPCIGPIEPALQKGEEIRVEIRGDFGRENRFHTVVVGGESLPDPPAVPEMKKERLRLAACGSDQGFLFVPTGSHASTWYQWRVRDLESGKIVYEEVGAFPHLHTGFSALQPGGDYRIYIQAGDHVGQVSAPMEMEFHIKERNPLILIGICVAGFLLVPLFSLVLLWKLRRRSKKLT